MGAQGIAFDQRALKKGLNTLSRQQCCWLATRCALRTLRVLAASKKGAFHSDIFCFWQKKERTIHLFSLFRAINATYSAVKAEPVNAAYSIEKPANAAANAARTAVNAIDAIYTAAKVAASFTAKIACAAAKPTDDDAKRIYISVFSTVVSCSKEGGLYKSFVADLHLVKSISSLPEWPDLWQGQKLPDQWDELEQKFVEELRSLGLAYWAETYAEWRVGKFSSFKLDRCLFMPQSFIDAGVDAMLSYLQGETVPVGEARIVFLGAPGAGRTSLINCLDQKPICPGEPATPRVAIRQRLEQIQGKKVLVHYWDFGGQVVMHATHQFFLRKNALYVVVLNIRRDDSPESWLNHIKTFADGSPTLIVLNKTDLLPQGPLPQPSFDLKRIRKQYSFVIDPVFCLSCKNREGFDAFQTRLYELLGSDHILKTDRPLEWFRVKEALTRGNQDFIPRQEFHQICQDQKLNEQSEKTMLEMLDTLGVVASFPELETHTDIVLNPEWITKAIYHIICACEKKDGFSGELSEKLMKQLFAKARNDPDFDIVIPDDKCLFLLELMQSFKLVFSLPGPENRYYVPMLAPINEPPHMVSRKDSLHLLLTFTFLSPELFYRFVVKSSREIVDGLIWRNGVILGQGINRLLIEYNKYQRTLECYAQGDDPGEYLNDILKRIQDIIHSDDKQVLCRPYIVLKNGDGFDVEDLKIRYLKNGYDSEEHGKKTWGTYTTIDLLKQLFGGNYEKIIAKEIEGELGSLNINININVQISWNLQELLDAKNQIKDLVRATKSFKRKNESAPVERKEQLDDLENGFDDLKDELDDLYDLQDKKAKKDDKRVKSAFRSINSFIDGLKKTDEAMDSVLGIGEKLASIADTVAKVLGAWPC